MVPDLSILRMRLLPLSAIYMFPDKSTAALEGLYKLADVAGPLSPEYPTMPLPATVVMIPPALQPVIAVWTQPVAGSHESDVQASLSSQLIEVNTQLPVAGLHESAVQALLSLHTMDVP
jgi:nitrate reductase beta subunit